VDLPDKILDNKIENREIRQTTMVALVAINWHEKNSPSIGTKSKKEPRLPKNLHTSENKNVLKDARELLKGDAKHS